MSIKKLINWIYWDNSITALLILFKLPSTEDLRVLNILNLKPTLSTQGFKKSGSLISFIRSAEPFEINLTLDTFAGANQTKERSHMC